LADVPLAGLMGQIRGLALAASDEGRADHDLLARFAADRDEAAFAALLHRHGGMVWSLCRRLLPQRADAEDAFQATFLVLARNPRAVRRGASLGNWLYGVARRVAIRLAQKARAARLRDAQANSPAPPTPEASLWNAEAQAVLDEELGRLPEKYRAPLLLCYLEGLTQDEAARQLGWAPGVLRGRLDRGRLRLRARLLQRGLAPSAALLGVALTTAPAPATLAVAAVKAACGRAVPSPAVVALTEGVLRAMLMTKVKVGTALVAVLGLTVLFAGVLSEPSSAQAPPDGRVPSDPAAEATTTTRRAPSDLEQRVAELERRVVTLSNLVEELRGRGKASTTIAPAPSKATAPSTPGVTPKSAVPDTKRDWRGEIPTPTPSTAEPSPARNNPPVSKTAPTEGRTQGLPATKTTTENLELNTFRVPDDEATEVVAALEKVFAGKTVRASAIAGNSSVLVYCSPADLRLVEEVLKRIQDESAVQRKLKEERGRIRK
jgi:RNA polymerase sigma factor (sigma-70 family)